MEESAGSDTNSETPEKEEDSAIQGYVENMSGASPQGLPVVATGQDDDDALMSDDDDAPMSEQEDNMDTETTPDEITCCVVDAITAKYRWSGGSARWMFNYLRVTIENKLREYCDKVANRKALLNQEIGPTSSFSTNHFFGSSRTVRNETEYFLVSQEAVRILSESMNRSTFESLYAFADRLENLAFVGWIVEADFFFQLGLAIRKKKPFDPPFSLPLEPILEIDFDHTKCCNLLLAVRSATGRKRATQKKREKIKNIAKNFVSKKGAIAAKPTRWNQGGYDVFFVQFVSGGESGVEIDIRFAQVTKGTKHGLKVGYLYSVLQFFREAGYVLHSVEIAFILTSLNSVDFSVDGVEADNTLKEYEIFGGGGQKWTTISNDSVTKYILDLSKASDLS